MRFVAIITRMAPNQVIQPGQLSTLRATPISYPTIGSSKKQFMTTTGEKKRSAITYPQTPQNPQKNPFMNNPSKIISYLKKPHRPSLSILKGTFSIERVIVMLIKT